MVRVGVTRVREIFDMSSNRHGTNYVPTNLNHSNPVTGQILDILFHAICYYDLSVFRVLFSDIISAILMKKIINWTTLHRKDFWEAL